MLDNSRKTYSENVGSCHDIDSFGDKRVIVQQGQKIVGVMGHHV
jgi:hypothetical protein